jgi:hypothetical protein
MPSRDSENRYIYDENEHRVFLTIHSEKIRFWETMCAIAYRLLREDITDEEKVELEHEFDIGAAPLAKKLRECQQYFDY